MRTLSLSLLALAFAVGMATSASACPMMKNAQTESTVADAGQPKTPSTPVKVPRAGS